MSSTLKEPYRIEGKKTMGIELAEQLGWKLPDVIFYPTGGGTGLIGMWKAFAELEAIGFIGRERPRMVAVQADRLRADRAGPGRKAASMPTRGRMRIRSRPASACRRAIGDFLILRAVRESGGFAIAVEDDDDPEAQAEMRGRRGTPPLPGRRGDRTPPGARRSPTAWSGARKRAVLFNCASGLKYPLPPL